MNVPPGYVLIAESALAELIGEEKLRSLKALCTVPVAPLPTLNPRRLDELEFQAASNGYTSHRAAAMLKGGVVAASLPHSVTVAITATELGALLAAYRSHHG